ncbi:DUF3467 domain-containing protein [Mammaliicoccus sciuri]
MNEQEHDIIMSDEAFYANAMAFNFNRDEIILNFEQRIPGAKLQSRTIILSPTAMQVIREGMEDMIDQYENVFVKNVGIKQNDSNQE